MPQARIRLRTQLAQQLFSLGSRAAFTAFEVVVWTMAWKTFLGADVAALAMQRHAVVSCRNRS